MGVSSSDCEGENYKTIAAQFEATGFTNIEKIDLKDSSWFGKDKKNTTVESVLIGGVSRFYKGDYFSPDAKVVISYH